jgi:hypothetical protein
VKNCIEINQYQQLDEIDDVYVQTTTTVEELRFLVTKALIEKQKLPPGTSPYRIRLRERYATNPGKILRSGSVRKVVEGVEMEDEGNRKTLSDLRIYLTDQKQIAVEILNEEEYLPEEDTGDVIVLVQRWNRSTWTMGMRVEVLFPGNMMVCDIAKGLSMLFDVPLASMRVLILPRETQISLYELSHQSPSSYYGRQWFDPTEETKLLRYMSHAMRLSDGDLVIIQDSIEPLMTLSPADQRSVELTEQASSLAGFFPSTTYSSSSTYYPSYTYGGTSTTTRSQGIKIKTYKDRKEEEEKKAAAAAASAGTDSSTDSANVVGVAVDAVPTSKQETGREKHSISIGTSTTHLTDLEDSGVHPLKDQSDFVKQGGFETYSAFM